MGVFSIGFVLGVASVLYMIFAGSSNFYYFVSDSNKILALWVGLSAFLVAKNSKQFVSPLINTLATGCFGALLIHANSNAMRTWLWLDFVNVPNAFFMDLSMLIGYSVLVSITIFLVCMGIDYEYRKLIEKPTMQYVYKHSGKIENVFQSLLKRFF